MASKTDIQINRIRDYISRTSGKASLDNPNDIEDVLLDIKDSEKKAKLEVLDDIKRWLKGRNINVQDKDKIREYINKFKKEINHERN